MLKITLIKIKGLFLMKRFTLIQIFAFLSMMLTFLFPLFASSNLAEKTKLRVMTYNLHAIPCIYPEKFNGILKTIGVNQCPDNTYWSRTVNERLDELTIILNNMEQKGELPDVLLLQEAFSSKISILDDSGVDRLIRNSPFSNYVKGPPGKITSILGAGLAYAFHVIGTVDSGLVTLSRYPIKKAARKAFKKCRDTDCLANKGILYTQIEIPELGQTIDVFNTHYQAGQRFEHVKLQQNQDFKQFREQVTNSKWQIAGGDFNFRNKRDFPSFNDFMTQTQMQYTGFICKSSSQCLKGPGMKPEWLNGSLLDHQFIQTFGNSKLTPVYIHYGDHKFRDGKLTDHPYLMVDYLIQ